jgi:hypothetical protein
MPAVKRKKLRRIIFILSGVLFFIAVVVFLANFYVEPVLRKRLHTLMVEGSDSLIHLHPGRFACQFFWWQRGVHDLHVAVDSTSTTSLKKPGKLPALVMQTGCKQCPHKRASAFLHSCSIKKSSLMKFLRKMPT